MRRLWELLAEKLGVNDLRQDFQRLEQRLDYFEKVVKSALRGFGDKQEKSDEKLNFMKYQINNLLEAVGDIIDHQENKELIQDAISLRRRLRNHRTRINKILDKRGASSG